MKFTAVSLGHIGIEIVEGTLKVAMYGSTEAEVRANNHLTRTSGQVLLSHFVDKIVVPASE